MIDVNDEKLIPLRDVPQMLPRRPNGKRLHISAVYRWTQRGVHGSQLETMKIGGTTYTSIQALQRFGVQKSIPSLQSGGLTSPLPSATATRQREIDRVSRRVDAILGTKSR